MTYWYIALAAFMISTAGCLYSMFKNEDYDSLSDAFPRVGLCFAISCVWPIAVIAIIAYAVSNHLNYEKDKNGPN